MKFKPTAAQLLAINGNENILVSAAAGSGKTAVLVERVIRLLTDPEAGVMADRLLIVTFTNAAAAELKLRIENRLNRELENSPYDRLLQKQKILLSNAKICTIDAFCIDFIRDNFEKAGIDPSFKMADEPTVRMLKATAMSELMNDEFNSGDESFLKLLEYIGSSYDDGELTTRLERVFEYSRQMPFPDKWINNVYENTMENAEGRSNEWLNDALLLVGDYATEAERQSCAAVEAVSRCEEVFEKYRDNLLYISQFSSRLNELSSNGDWDGVYSHISTFAPPALKRVPSSLKTDDVIYGMGVRDEAVKIIKNIRGIVYADTNSVREELEYSLPYVKKICDLVSAFEKKLYTSFAERGLMTFYMAEQTALSLLAEYRDGSVVRSDGADEYIAAYDAVLVDEYQDTNDLQDCLFNILSDDQKNLFCVGDAKQSIYRFRGANPRNFIEKKRLYRDESESDRFGLRVDLSGNFRSRPEICGYVNRLFGFIMNEKNAQIEYDRREKLVSLASFPENTESKVRTVFVDMNAVNAGGCFEDVSDSENKTVAEAEVIARTVLDTVNAEPFIKSGDALRKAGFKDITVLLRSPSKNAQIIASVLRKNGIPVNVSASNAFDSEEVVTVLSLLRIINNPFDDIALLTVMTSQIFGFTVNELAVIRAYSKRSKLISAVSSAAAKGDMRAGEFLRVISSFRNKNAVSRIYELIDHIYETTNYTGIVSRLEDGDKKKANLIMLRDLAASFEADGRKNLREFLRSVEGLRDSDIKNELSSGTDSVRIMSIHASKGLQFPVCILADTDHRFNFSDSTAALLIDEHYGFSFKYYDKESREKTDTLLRLLMAKYEKNQLLAEEVRLLYVALTRAEDKLIITSCFKDLKKEIAALSDNGYHDNGQMRAYNFSKTDCYADWLLSEAFYNGADKFLDYLNNGVPCDEIITEIPTAGEREEISHKADSEKVALLQDIYSYEYPYKDILQLESKASVTDIVHKADETKYQFTARPAFMNSDGLSAAQKGTSTHRFMQFCDFDRASDSVGDECEQLYESGYLTYEEAECVDRDAVNGFFESELFARLRVASAVRREMNFLAEFPAGDIRDALSESLRDEKIIVQGAVDLLFEEDGGIVIVDFKTDRNKSRDDLINAYAEQLRIYGKACSGLLKKPVKQLIIYSFTLGQEIEVS